MLQFTPNSNIINEPSKLFMSLSAFQNCIKLNCDLVGEREQHNLIVFLQIKILLLFKTPKINK